MKIGKSTQFWLTLLFIFMLFLPMGSCLLAEGDAIGYGFMAVILMFFIGSCIYIFTKSEIIWVRALCLGMGYLFFLIISYASWVTSTALTESAFFDIFFKWSFLIGVYGIIPLVLGMFIYVVYRMITIKEMERMVSHGVIETDLNQRLNLGGGK